jgi:hypothetical protein
MHCKRMLHKPALRLELPKLTFQVIRRTIATLTQKKGTVKDVQGLLRHSRTATTTDVYMQKIPESVQATVNSISQELRKSRLVRNRRTSAKSISRMDRTFWRRSANRNGAGRNLTQMTPIWKEGSLISL